MVVAMNGIIPAVEQNKTSYIASLCDVVPNKKRDEKDFRSLLQCLEHMPKECIPFKGRILSHLRIHALENPAINIRLLAGCFAKATLLYRKTPNKSEGPVGCWKSGLRGELIILEENLNQLYSIAGLNTSNILDKSSSGEGGGEDDDNEYLKSHEKLSESTVDFENIINEHLLKINLATHNICALISVETEFDLPLPVFVLLKLAAKIGLIRWKDYKKKPNGLLKNYVYSLAPCLLETNLMLFRSIITVLGTNIIPFTTFINQTLIRILDWTRSSNLAKYYEDVYHTVRSQVFKMITFMAEQLSLNINFEPAQLKVLLTSELVDNLEELLTKSDGNVKLKDKHVVSALECLENLLVVYRDLLDATLANKCKSYVIQSCLEIYRDFSLNSIGQTCRKKLLELLQTIANQPYATSTTEISYHIFELAEKFESDPEMRSLARRSLKIGLAHRPTIVTHHDVYNYYGRPMLSAEDMKASSQPSVEQETTSLNQTQPLEQQPTSAPPELEKPTSPKPLELTPQPNQTEPGSPEPASTMPEPMQESAPLKPTELGSSKSGEETAQAEEQANVEDSEILSYMSFFVEKLA